MEEITHALLTASLLVSDLNEIAKKANKAENFPLAILTRQMMESTIKTVQTLNEMQ